MSAETVQRFEELSREELEERIEELEESNEQLEKNQQQQEALVKALHKKITRIESILVGDDRELHDDRFDVEDDIYTQIQDAAESSQQALAVVKANKGTTKGTKKDVAKRLSRDRVVLKTVGTSQKAAAISCGDVIEMALPGKKLQHRSILDAWRDELVAEWEAFEIVKKDGKKQLRCYSDRLDPALVRVVKDSLSDSGSTESLNSWLANEGVQQR